MPALLTSRCRAPVRSSAKATIASTLAGAATLPAKPKALPLFVGDRLRLAVHVPVFQVSTDDRGAGGGERLGDCKTDAAPEMIAVFPSSERSKGDPLRSCPGLVRRFHSVATPPSAEPCAFLCSRHGDLIQCWVTLILTVDVGRGPR